MARANRPVRKKVQGATSSRRHQANIKQQLDEVRASYIVGSNLDAMVLEDTGGDPHKENLYRRLARGGATFMAQHERATQERAVI